MEETTYELHNYKSMIMHTFHKRPLFHFTSLHFTSLPTSLHTTFRHFVTTLRFPFTYLTNNYFPNHLPENKWFKGEIC
jgi:hypothetical protein